MADQRGGGITWTEQTWNPIRGCRRKSDECTRCYAERVAARFSKPGQPYHRLAEMTPSGPRWTGAIRLIEEHLFDPLRWKRPRLVFANSMSDLFYEDLDEGDIDRIVAVMFLAKRQTFQVLTKRYERMADYLTAPGRAARIAQVASQMLFDLETGRYAPKLGKVEKFGGTWVNRGKDQSPVITVPMVWPLPNVWWGFSAGRQKTFDEAMPHIVRMERHAAIRWWSAEPLLEAIDCSPARHMVQGITHGRGTNINLEDWLQNLDWVVVGGESQDGCRPMDPEWARGIKARADNRTDMGRPWALPFHMKQLGGDPDPRKKLEDLPPDLRVRDYPRTATA